MLVVMFAVIHIQTLIIIVCRVKVQWGSLLGQGSDIDTICLSFSYIKTAGSGSRGLKPVWKKFINSLHDLYLGVDPESGEPLAFDVESGGSWKAIMLFGKSDLEQSMTWGLVSYNSPDDNCPDCNANRSDKPFTDLKPNAAWVPTAVNMTNEVFLSRCHGAHPIRQSFFGAVFLPKGHHACT